jgi:Trypsin-like peptidase domain
MIRQLLGAMAIVALFNPQPSAAKPITEIVAAAKPAIVTIQTFDSNKEPISLGTGFFISESRIVTNSHVIKDAEYLRITDLNGNKYSLDKVIADDGTIDLALLSVSGNHPFLNLDLTTCIEGQNILVIGNPEGLQGTVTSGIISAIRSDVNRYQISAPISPGSSGSPVLNENGDVIGVVVSQFKEGQNLNFAIPSSAIANVRYPKVNEPDFLPNPNAQIPDDTAPKSNLSSADEPRAQIAALINRYLDATQNGQPTSLTPFCTLELTEWYGEKNLPIKKAEKSIANYYRAWPYQVCKFDIKDLHISSVKGAADTYIAWIPFDWDASNGKKHLSGHSVMEAVVILTTNGYGYRIAAIRNFKAD